MTIKVDLNKLLKRKTATAATATTAAVSSPDQLTTPKSAQMGIERKKIGEFRKAAFRLVQTNFNRVYLLTYLRTYLPTYVRTYLTTYLPTQTGYRSISNI